MGNAYRVKSHRARPPRPRPIPPPPRADHADVFLETNVAAHPAAGNPARILFRKPARSAVPPRWRTFGKLLDNRAAVLTRLTGGTRIQREETGKSTFRVALF